MNERRAESMQPKDLGLLVTQHSVSKSGLEGSNEDGRYRNMDRGIALVVDGEGVGDCGFRANQIALLSLSSSLSAIESTDLDDIAVQMRNAFVTAHEQVRAEVPRGKASATAVKVVDTDIGRTALIASVGLSRAYLLRDGELELITRDHSVPIVEKYTDAVQDQMDSVKTNEDLCTFKKTSFGSLSGSYFWDKRFVATHEIGARMPDIVPVYEIPLQRGDRILVASRGLQNLTRDEIKEGLSASLDSPARTLVGKAVSHAQDTQNVRYKLNDMTAVTVEIMPRPDKIKNYELGSGTELDLDYSGLPITVTMPDGRTMLIGKPSVVGFNEVDHDGFVVVNTGEQHASNGQKGGYWLTDEQCVQLGKANGDVHWKVHHGNYPSMVKIRKRGDRLTFKNLNSIVPVHLQQRFQD